MGDNLSAMVRTAVTYVLLGCVVIFVVVMVTIGSQRLNDTTGMVSANVGVMEQNTLINISGKMVSGASAYRIFTTHQGAVKEFKIKMKNGRTYTAMSQLMSRDFLAKEFYCNSYQIDGGMWIVQLEER